MFFLVRNSSSSFLLSSSQRMFARWTGQKCFSSIKTDYYKILGVNNNSTQDQIKKEFHRLAKLHHPDSAENQGDNEKFKEISEAYNVLGDAEKRVKYDSDLNLEKQRQEAQQQHHQRHTHGFSQSGSHSSHNNQHFHKHHEFKRRHQQHDENNEESRTARSAHPDGFDGKDDFGEKQSVWVNLKTVPELWLIAGLFGMLVMRWIYLAHSPNQRGKISMDPFDDDFEVSADRKNKKIELKHEDVHGMSLAVLDQIYSTGKYELPPKVKVNVEEYRNLMGKANRKNGQQGENQEEQGNIAGIQNENSYLQKQKKEELGTDKIKENGQDKSNIQTKETILQLKPVEKTEIVETPRKSRRFNYAQRFNQKDKADTTIPESTDSQVSSSESNYSNQTVTILDSLENKDEKALEQQKIEQQRSSNIIQQRQQRQYERQKLREKVEEDQTKGWLPVNRESSIPSFINQGQSQNDKKQNQNNGLQDQHKQENEKV